MNERRPFHVDFVFRYPIVGYFGDPWGAPPSGVCVNALPEEQRE